MATEVRIPSAPSPSLTTNTTPETKDSPEPNRMILTEASAHERAIVQQRQQNTSKPSPPARQ